MHVRCPHCHNRIELIDDAPLEDILCTSCGSSFSLVDNERWTTIDYQANKQIGHFELIEQLGVGAFGSVWRAKDTQLDREVAIKVPRKEQLDPAEAERFIREARAAAQLRHPSIVQVHEVGRDGDQLYIVSDLVRGATLADWLTGRQLTPGEAAELCVTLAEALHHAHQQGVVHRDLKPGNIMLDMDGKPHILDFGLAKREAREVTMTIDGRVLGTPAYMSPEQARGEGHDADARSDVYSLGVILFQLVTGELPFRGNQRMLLVQIQTDEPPSPRRLNAAIPRDLETITLRCLEKSPDRRYQTAQDLADELRRYARGEPIQARPITRLERTWRWSKRQPLAAGLIMAFVGALLIGMINTSYFALRASARARELAEETERANDNARLAQQQRDRADEEAKRANAKAVEADESATLERIQRQRADRKTRESRHLLYDAHLNLAGMAWHDGDVSRVLELLDLHGPGTPSDEVRGFEWHYLHHLCYRDLHTVKGHPRGVVSLAVSPDGLRIASASPGSPRKFDAKDGMVQLWDAITGNVIRTITGHTNLVASVGFSPDGARIASATGNRQVGIWDTATGQVISTLQKHGLELGTIAFSPDGVRIASASDDGMVKLWNAMTGEETATLKGQTGKVACVVFSPDGARVAAAGDDGALRLWDAATGARIATLMEHSSRVTSIAFSPDGAWIASAGDDGLVKLWDAVNGKSMAALKGHTGGAASVAFSPDGTLIASSDARSVRLWNTRTRKPIATLKGHTQAIKCVAFLPNGARIASASDDATIRIWDVGTRQEAAVLAGYTGGGIVFSRDGARIAFAGKEATAKLWDAMTLHEFGTLRGHARLLTCVAFSLDGARIAFGGQDGTVDLCDAATKKDIATLRGHGRGVASLAFSTDGARIASAGDDGTVKLWDAATGEQIATLEGHTGRVTSVALSRDGSRTATVSWNGIVKLWDGVQDTATLKGGTSGLEQVAFSPSGRQLASTQADDTVRLWDVATGERAGVLKGHTGRVAGFAFSPDGAQLASASWDGTVKLWDTATRQEIVSLKTHTDHVDCVTFSPDGTRIVSAGDDGAVTLWDAATGEQTATLRGHTAGIRSVTFSDDGGRIASGSWDGTVRIWDARPMTPVVKAEVEAVALLDFLFFKPLPRGEVLAALLHDKHVRVATRRQALELVDRYQEENDPQKYHDAAWRVIRHPYSNVFVVQFALAQMKAACERAPQDADYRGGLAVAQYRLGKFENPRYAEALVTLQQCDQTQPTTLAFLTMTQQRLDQKAEAQTTLTRLQELMKEPKWASDPQAQAFVREAEQLIELP